MHAVDLSHIYLQYPTLMHICINWTYTTWHNHRTYHTALTAAKMFFCFFLQTDCQWQFTALCCWMVLLGHYSTLSHLHDSSKVIHLVGTIHTEQMDKHPTQRQTDQQSLFLKELMGTFFSAQYSSSNPWCNVWRL